MGMLRMKFTNKPNMPIECQVKLRWHKRTVEDFPPEVDILQRKYYEHGIVDLDDLGINGGFYIFEQNTELSYSGVETSFLLRRIS